MLCNKHYVSNLILRSIIVTTIFSVRTEHALKRPRPLLEKRLSGGHVVLWINIGLRHKLVFIHVWEMFCEDVPRVSLDLGDCDFLHEKIDWRILNCTMLSRFCSGRGISALLNSDRFVQYNTIQEQKYVKLLNCSFYNSWHD